MDDEQLLFPGLLSPVVMTYLIDVVDAEGELFQTTVTEYISEMDLMLGVLRPRRHRPTENVVPSPEYL